MDIEHFVDGESHGPVAAFLSDAGKIAFVCRVDGAYWEGEMPQLQPPSKAAELPAVDGPDDDAAGASTLADRLHRPSGTGRAARVMSQETARETAGDHFL